MHRDQLREVQKMKRSGELKTIPTETADGTPTIHLLTEASGRFTRCCGKTAGELPAAEFVTSNVAAATCKGGR